MNAEEPKWVAKQLCDLAWRNGSTDNICAIVVDLRDHRLLVQKQWVTNGPHTKFVKPRGKEVTGRKEEGSPRGEEKRKG